MACGEPASIDPVGLVTASAEERQFSDVGHRDAVLASKEFPLVCCCLNRLARSTRDLLDIAKMLDTGVDLVVLEQPINTTTPEGRLFSTMIAAFAEFETEIDKRRQRERIDAALAKGTESPFPTVKPESVKRLASQGCIRRRLAGNSASAVS